MGRPHPNDLELPEEWNGITRTVIACAMEVHTALGPGLLERIYEDAMAVEMRLRGLRFDRQVPVRLSYKGVELSPQRLDLVVEHRVIVELKSVEAVPEAHLAQLTSYLRSARLPLGLLINFNCRRLKDGIFRRINSAAAHPHPTPPSLSLRSSAPSATSAVSPSE